MCPSQSSAHTLSKEREKGKAAKAVKVIKAKTTKRTKGKVDKPKKTRAMPAYHLSSELAVVVGASEMARGEVTKKVWDYIKAQNLQDANNKRLIHPDNLLSKVFGSNEPIDMFKMSELLSSHLQK